MLVNGVLLQVDGVVVVVEVDGEEAEADETDAGDADGGCRVLWARRERVRVQALGVRRAFAGVLSASKCRCRGLCHVRRVVRLWSCL